MPLMKYEDFLDFSIKDFLTKYLSVCGLNTSSRKVELEAWTYQINVGECSRQTSSNPSPVNAENPSQYPKSCPKANSSPKSAISGYFIKISIQ